MDGVATALPALLRSHKLQKRAARVGFEWPDVEGPIAKLHEELAELDNAETLEDRLIEAGDVLFAAVNIIRRYGGRTGAGAAGIERQVRTPFQEDGGTVRQGR